MTTKGKILWVDDEIELLRSHIIFLEERGYEVERVTNADDAITLISQQFNFITDPEYFAFCCHLKSKTIYQNKEI